MKSFEANPPVECSNLKTPPFNFYFTVIVLVTVSILLCARVFDAVSLFVGESPSCGCAVLHHMYYVCASIVAASH